ncbi:MAG: hypothetical protein KTR31_11860 [Myxococcales bacterium]|nr:hypothetical protein [Myxococcales bacterium]
MSSCSSRMPTVSHRDDCFEVVIPDATPEELMIVISERLLVVGEGSQSHRMPLPNDANLDEATVVHSARGTVVTIPLLGVAVSGAAEAG